jgi:hypothetical protein
MDIVVKQLRIILSGLNEAAAEMGKLVRAVDRTDEPSLYEYVQGLQQSIIEASRTVDEAVTVMPQMINESIRSRRQEAPERIVENSAAGTLEGLDEDCSILDVPLRLSEACSFDFDKHVTAITGDEDQARDTHRERYTKLNYAQENARRYDARYKERPGNRIKYKK